MVDRTIQSETDVEFYWTLIRSLTLRIMELEKENVVLHRRERSRDWYDVAEGRKKEE